MAFPYSVPYRAGTLSEAQYNSDQSLHAAQNIPTSINDFSNDVGEMQTTTNPGGLGSESLAIDLSGELARLRYMIKLITGQAQWYVDPGVNLSAIQTFPSGTKLVFQQTAAPAGWTKQSNANYNDAVFRCVTGAVNDPASTNPGRANFLAAFMAQTTVGNHSLTSAEMPIHVHALYATQIGASGAANFTSYSASPAGAVSTTGTAQAGSGGSHNHTLTTNISYVDLIVATKN